MQARNEVAVLAALDHINIVKYYDCFTAERGRIQIVMELCEVCISDRCLKQCARPTIRQKVHKLAIWRMGHLQPSGLPAHVT